MSELLGQSEVARQLGDAGLRIDALLSSVPEVFDGTNVNIFDNVGIPDYANLGVAVSLRPDGTVNYHVSTQTEIADGYIDTWDFHWSNGEGAALYGRSHESRRFNSISHPDDFRFKNPIRHSHLGQIALILDEYETFKVE